MKTKFYLICLALLAAFSSCSIKEEVAPEAPALRFRGIMEVPEYLSETRAYADQGYHVYWYKGDRVSIFTEKTYNRQYEFVGRTGTTAGDFEIVQGGSGIITEVPIESGYNYAIYPYFRYNACDYDGTLTVTFPEERTYDDYSRSIGANMALVARAEAQDFTWDLSYMVTM